MTKGGCTNWVLLCVLALGLGVNWGCSDSEGQPSSVGHGAAGAGAASGASGTSNSGGSGNAGGNAAMAGSSGTGAGTSFAPLTVESYDVSLRALFSPYYPEERKPLVLKGLLNSTADVLCLNQVYSDADKTALVEGLGEMFPYQAWFKTDLSTVADDPTRLDGSTPEPKTQPACASGQLDDLLACTVENCTMPPGGEDSYITNFDCVSTYCSLEYAALLFGDQQSKECYMCGLLMGASHTLTEMREHCTNTVSPMLAFDGSSGNLLLSKYPLTGTAQWVYPSAFYTQTAIRASIVLQANTSVDVYCTAFTEARESVSLPYVWDYSTGGDGVQGWWDHQDLQATQLIDFVKKKSGETPAVVLGNYNAGREVNNPETACKAAGSQNALDLLYDAFEEGVATDFTPQCTQCAENPLANDESGWVSHILLYGLSKKAVVNTEITMSKATVLLTSPTVGTLYYAPPSSHYGLRSTINVEIPEP